MVNVTMPMQFFVLSMYLYIVKTMRHLLLLALLGSAVVLARPGSAVITTATDADETSALSGETYAVIISGGRSKMFNHERYWNDCAFLYRTLRQDCNIPKDHITLLMADGDNPATDMLRDGARGFASSPTDLDGDGQADLTLAATRQNVDNTLRQLAATMTSADHIFLFITDHGERDADFSGRTADRDQSAGGAGIRLWLWGNEQVSPDELAAMVGQCHPATMNILLGQCYAGAFVEKLRSCGVEDGCIITAACSAEQMSWSCKDRCYDEFVYHWTCAIAQHDEQGQPIDSDQDGDGCISMYEAFDYARQHDRRPETPSLTAQPATMARQWSFGRMGIENDIPQIPTLNPQISTIYDLQGRKLK